MITNVIHFGCDLRQRRYRREQRPSIATTEYFGGDDVHKQIFQVYGSLVYAKARRLSQ